MLSEVKFFGVAVNLTVIADLLSSNPGGGGWGNGGKPLLGFEFFLVIVIQRFLYKHLKFEVGCINSQNFGNIIVFIFNKNKRDFLNAE